MPKDNNKDNNKDNEWSAEQEAEIARLIEVFKLPRIKAIQKMQRQKNEKAERLRLYGPPADKKEQEKSV